MHPHLTKGPGFTRHPIHQAIVVLHEQYMAAQWAANVRMLPAVTQVAIGQQIGTVVNLSGLLQMLRNVGAEILIGAIAHITVNRARFTAQRQQQGLA